MSLLALSFVFGGYLFAFRFFNNGASVQTQVMASTVTVVDLKENDMKNQINGIRRGVGVPEVTYNFGLKDLTTMRLTDMVENEYYSHTTPQGYTYGNFMSKYSPDSTFSCENLQLQAGSDANSVISAWVDSPAHYRCLVHPGVSKIAISYAVYSEVLPMQSETEEQMYIFAMITAN